jgi:CRP-like cAMP-binding protein
MPDKISSLLEEGTDFIFSESIRRFLDENCTIVSFSKNKILLLQGEKSLNLFFIIKGLIRGFYTDEKGNEVTKCFSCENEFFSTEGLRNDNPSSFNIECLEDCKCIQVPYRVLNIASNEDKNLLTLINRYTSKAMTEIEDKAKNLMIKSAEERYRLFREQYPKLYKRINQKYIASYIGIREGSLSRIKKQVKMMKN